MASQKIDELQINIGSDATRAIDQLNNLSAALTLTAASASRLARATSSLDGFTNAIARLASTDAKTAASNIRTLNSALGGKNLKSKQISLDISVNGLDQIEKIKDFAMPKVGTVNLKDTGINSFINAMRRLASVDMSKFNVDYLDKVTSAVYKISSVKGVDKTISSFVTALSKLASVGENTQKTADGLTDLTKKLRTMIKAMNLLGGVDTSITAFVAALAQLASAGVKTRFTGTALGTLADAVIDFINRINNAPEISDKVAQTIQGLGQLAASGQKFSIAWKNMGDSSGGGNWLANLVANSTITGLKTIGNDIGWVLGKVLQLGGKGASALGRFLQMMRMIPGGASGINRTALSFGNLLRAVLPFYGIRGIFNWAKESFEAGSSIVELRNVIDTSFGSIINGYRDISGYIYKWSQGTVEAFGISEIAAQKYAGRLMSMFNSSGFDASEEMRNSAAKMTTDLVERAGDIASFYEITADEAMTKMQAALAGMTRPMRALGVNMNVANLEAFALEHGITQSWQSMDQATQMAVRYAYMLEKTRYAEGDFAATSMSASNQAKLLSVNIGQLSATFGQGLVPAIAPVLAWLNALIKRLIQAANAFRLFMFTLFGKPLAAAKGMLDDTAGYLDDAAGAAGDLGSAGGGAADGLGSAGKAAKELKKQLTTLPFDELNQLAKDTDSAGSGGSGGGGGGGGVGGIGGLGDMGLMPDYDGLFEDSPVVEAINRWAARIREAFQKHQWKNLGRIVAEGINAGFQFIYDALSWSKIKPIIVDGFITPFQTTINSMADWINWDLIGRTFGRGLNTVVYTLVAWINGFHWRDFGTHLAEGLNGMIDEWNAMEFGRLLASKFRAAWDFFGGLVSKFDYNTLGRKLKELVRTAINTLNPKDMGESLGTFINGLADTINEFLGDGKVQKDLSDAFAEFINSFIQKLDAKKVKGAIKTVVDTIVGVAWQTFKKVDMMPLIGDLLTILSGLPWGLIGTAIVGHAVGAIAKALAGGVISKLLIDAIVGAITGGGGGGVAIAGSVKATGAAATTGAATAGGAAAGATIAGIGAVVAPLAGIAALMRRQVNKTGGTKQFKGQNLAPSYQQPKQQAPVSGQNAAGYSTKIQTIPQASAAPKTTPTASTGGGEISGITAKIKTILFGEKDPSFTNLELAKSSLLETPIVKKIMNGELTSDFKDGYKKFTDTKLYNVIKTFTGQDKGGFLDKYGKYIYTKVHNVTKWFNGGNGNGFLDKFSKYIYTKTHNVTKWFTGENGNNFLDKFSKYIYTKSHNVTKWFTGKDGGNFISYFNKFAYSLYDKTVKVTFDIITTAKNVVASIVGKGREILASIWTENAKGGLFTGPTGFQVFGEAGAEAAIPLERKSTMKRIGNAIVNAGGMGTSNSEDIANAVAEKIAPIIMSAMSGQENRPINVNATLYTENNEVLARAVNQGNRSLDKRYNPVTQYSY